MILPKMKVQRRYDPSGDALMSGHDPHKEADQAMAAAIFEILMRAYPSHYWMVEANSKQGIARIRIPHIMGPTLGYTLHLPDLTSPNEAKRRVILAGGEILERWRIPRSGLDLAAFVEARTHKRIMSIHDPIPS